MSGGPNMLLRDDELLTAAATLACCCGGKHDWAIPGKTISSANLDFARTVCRRAERSIVALTDQTISETSQPIIYLNRLSDLLWLMARSVEQSQN